MSATALPPRAAVTDGSGDKLTPPQAADILLMDWRPLSDESPKARMAELYVERLRTQGQAGHAEDFLSRLVDAGYRGRLLLTYAALNEELSVARRGDGDYARATAWRHCERAGRGYEMALETDVPDAAARLLDHLNPEGQWGLSFGAAAISWASAPQQCLSEMWDRGAARAIEVIDSTTGMQQWETAPRHRQRMIIAEAAGRYVEAAAHHRSMHEAYRLGVERGDAGARSAYIEYLHDEGWADPNAWRTAISLMNAGLADLDQPDRIHEQRRIGALHIQLGDMSGAHDALEDAMENAIEMRWKGKEILGIIPAVASWLSRHDAAYQPGIVLLSAALLGAAARRGVEGADEFLDKFVHQPIEGLGIGGDQVRDAGKLVRSFVGDAHNWRLMNAALNGTRFQSELSYCLDYNRHCAELLAAALLHDASRQGRTLLTARLASHVAGPRRPSMVDALARNPTIGPVLRPPSRTVTAASKRPSQMVA